MTNQGKSDHEGDGVDRRGFLKCMAWAGTGLMWSVGGGILSSRAFGQGAGQAGAGSFSFVQISDSHLGFARDPNKDVAATLKQTIARINALPEPPAFVLHTGDLTHLAKPDEFDAVAELLKEVKAGKVLLRPRRTRFRRGRQQGIPETVSGRVRRGRGGTASTTTGSTSSAL